MSYLIIVQKPGETYSPFPMAATTKEELHNWARENARGCGCRYSLWEQKGVMIRYLSQHQVTFAR
jgi:hypothetical protein